MILDPADKITFSVLANSAIVDFNAGARIAGVSSLKIVKDVVKGTTFRKRPWTVYPVGLFSILLGAVSLFGILMQYPKEIKIKTLVKNGNFEFPETLDKQQCIAWINSTFDFTTNKERSPLIAAIHALPDRENFMAVHHEFLEYEIRNLLSRAMSNLVAAIIVVIIASLGGWYVISNF